MIPKIHYPFWGLCETGAKFASHVALTSSRRRGIGSIAGRSLLLLEDDEGTVQDAVRAGTRIKDYCTARTQQQRAVAGVKSGGGTVPYRYEY